MPACELICTLVVKRNGDGWELTRFVQVGVVSCHGWEGLQRMATSMMDTKAQVVHMVIVVQMAIECPFPGVNRRKRNAVEHFEKNRVTM